MLALFPLLVYLGLFLLLGNLQPEPDWRRAALRAAILWGCILTAIIELLSLPHAIQPAALVGAWGLAGILVAVVAVSWIRRGHAFQFPPLRWPDHGGAVGILVGISVVVLITGVVAWFAPPQTWDSLNYHMSRVAHWAQNRSVAPFATGIETQNSRTPWSEFAVLNLYVLGGGDRLVNFVQWSVMILSLIGVSTIARDLGAPPVGQWLAAAFVASLPMGMIQASSTTTDYVVAFWTVCLAAEWAGLFRRTVGKSALVYGSLAAGLGALSKPTALAFMLPFVILIAAWAFKHWRARDLLPWAAVAALAVLGINSGHLLRTYQVYGSLIEGEQFGVHANQVLDGKGVVSVALRNVAMQLGTPSPYVNKAIYQSVLTIHEWMSLDPNDPRTTSAGRFAVRPPQTSEDLASNSLQAYALVVVFLVLFLNWRAYEWMLAPYALALIAAFLVFSAAFKWQIFGVRYELPLFVLGGPIAGLILARPRPRSLPAILAIVLIGTSWPWLLRIDSRPLLPAPGSSVGSILVQPRTDLYFANGPYLERPYRSMVSQIKEERCRSVGLSLSGNGAEYPLWVLLGAPSNDLRVEWLVGGTASARYSPPDFVPCAVICERCPQSWLTVRGLPLLQPEATGEFRLFMAAPLGLK